MKKILLLIFIICLGQFFTNNLYTVEPDEILKNQEQEAKARKISNQMWRGDKRSNFLHGNIT